MMPKGITPKTRELVRRVDKLVKNHGQTVVQACRNIGSKTGTYYRAKKILNLEKRE